jgi:hypothetical protein
MSVGLVPGVVKLRRDRVSEHPYSCLEQLFAF